MRQALFAALLLGVLSLSGCSKERMPYMGHWLGGFKVTSSTTPDETTKDIDLNGYLQLYRVKDKFIIQLSNKLQVLTLGGTWKIVGPHRIELTFNAFRLDEPDLDKIKAMRRPFIDPTELQAAYNKPMILDLKPDGSLEGLLVRVGPMLGKHEFRKGQ